MRLLERIQRALFVIEKEFGKQSAAAENRIKDGVQADKSKAREMGLLDQVICLK